MVAQVVQDCTFEDFENVACQRDKIEEELEDMQQLLGNIEKAQEDNNGIEMGPSTSNIGG
jgi:chaperonin cofactor prefoldin